MNVQSVRQVAAFTAAGVGTGLAAAAGDRESKKPGNGSNAVIGLTAAGTTLGIIGIGGAGMATRNAAGAIAGLAAVVGTTLLAT